MLLCCITLSSSRENHRSAQEVARRISGAVAGEAYARLSQDLDSRQRAISGAIAGEVYAKVNIPSTHHNPYLLHYIIFQLPLVFLSPTSPLSFYPPSLSLSSLSFSICLFLPACFLFARMVGIVVYLLLNGEPKIYGSSSAC